MDKTEEHVKSSTSEINSSSRENNSTKNKAKNRGKKRKRPASESSSEFEDVLPENTLEVEKSVHDSAVKNNLDDISVRKILKKVVSNDHVLALVKLREEEEDSGPEENSLRPKLTRAKVKELMKVSPKTAAWNLENLELTPIKHIPVKTRPEVKALIAQELPEDEDDDEYEPTQEDVPSDDDQGLESCSDLDSQPRTPATPRSQHTTSPKIVTDGPFKVPQDVSTPTRRKLDLEEDATIALRTRSKLSLSATSIEHIESTFVPPDDIPMPAVDDLWNQFLNECLNPASTSKNEDDDETDPEYNVAADPDAHDEDEEALGNSLIKISKKELNDLVTELFNIMPEASADDELMADNLANSVLTDHSQAEVSTRWEGKQEPMSDDENGNRQKLSDRIRFEKKNYSRLSVGKTEPPDIDEASEANQTPAREKKDTSKEKKGNKQKADTLKPPAVVNVSVEEHVGNTPIQKAPPLLQSHLKPAVRTECVHIQVNKGVCVLPEQIKILQQQLRQHIQLATSNYLQLYVHPVHWSYAPPYKEYLETFTKLAEKNPKSVVNVCNLKPAVELVNMWEKTVSTDTPENAAMVQFIQKESDRCLRRGQNKNLYVGDFHETFKKIVANSPVFLYPYLLPPMPYRGDHPRRFCYLHSEDELIALGLDQFWQYVSNNPSIYKPRNAQKSHPRHRWGLNATMQLVVKYMFPWMPVRVLSSHIQNVRKTADKENPIYKFFKNHEVTPVKHVLLPFNPQLTLYEQPEHEVPRIWVRYLAHTSKRFKNYLFKRTNMTGFAPRGVEVNLGQEVAEPTKAPLPIDFTKQIVSHRTVINLPSNNPPLADKFDIQITNNVNNGQAQTQVSNLYKFVETSTGAYLLPLTMTVNSNTGPITTPNEISSNIIANDLPETSQTAEVKNSKAESDHCTCCVLLRKICKQRQTVITDYFGKKRPITCGCREKKYPKITNRLKLLVNNYKNNYTCALEALEMKLSQVVNESERLNETNYLDSDIDDIAYVTSFHLKLLSRSAIAKGLYIKKKVHSLLSKFKPNEHDPLRLAADLDKAFGVELVDMYKEFLGFLTPEQADKLDGFRDYFIRNCVIAVVKRVEEEVRNGERRRKILKELNGIFSKNFSTACEICTGLLSTLDGYPKLAEYVHSLFPHRKEKRPDPKAAKATTSQETSESTEKLLDESVPCTDEVMDYEADQSMSEDEGNNSNSEGINISELESNDATSQPIKTENTSSEYITPTSESVTLVVTVSKTEVQDFNESSNTSLKIMFDDEVVKSETPEWKRDEDKLILEVLKEQLTPEERQDKTIVEIIEDKHIIDMISESLTHKSESEIKTRLFYLLQLC